MRDLIGRIPTKECNVAKRVYFSELVRCRDCQQTVPVGIEVITFKNVGESKEVLKHEYYCRAHGVDYVTKAQNLPMKYNPQGRKVA
jgi:hypothetical protein